MKTLRLAALILGASFLALAAPASTPTGSIEFEVRVTPSGGLAEPVRGLPFYLLRKSFRDIQKEASASVPKPNLDAFVDGLSVSKELKAWMKQHHSVSLAGEDFLRSLKPDDVLRVPEFWAAYLARNTVQTSFGFPTPKYHLRDRKRDPQKYARLKSEYRTAVRKYLAANPQSVDGMDLNLNSIDPSHQWTDLNARRVPEVRRRALDLAHTRYFVAQAETDLNGHGEMTGIPPGAYWLSTLEIEAQVGDARARWDFPVFVRPGPVTRIELSNFNAVEPSRPKPAP